MNEKNTKGPRSRSRLLKDLSPAGKIWIRLGILVFCALAVIALMADIRAFQKKASSTNGQRLIGANAGDRQDLILGLNEPPFADPAGFFTIVPPKGWRIEVRPEGTSYNVVFLGPHKMDISIQANPVEDDHFGNLLKRIWAIEKEFNADMHVETISFTGRPAVRRTVRLLTQKLLMIDYVEEGVAHHIQFSAPPELFDYYMPAVMQVLETYKPAGAVNRNR
jgi:hypothetical protein